MQSMMIRNAGDAWCSSAEGRDEAREKYGEISTWDVSQVTNFEGMFFGRAWDGSGEPTYCNTPWTADLSAWNTSRAVSMSFMFEGSGFSGNIASWDTSSVEELEGMFSHAAHFNSPLGGWDVSRVVNFERTFHSAIRFNQPLSDWDVSSGQYASDMFVDARDFNQDISSWNIENMQDMSSMFNGAAKFNSDLSQWNARSQPRVEGIFMNAVAMDQNFGKWTKWTFEANPFATEEDTQETVQLNDCVWDSPGEHTEDAGNGVYWSKGKVYCGKQLKPLKKDGQLCKDNDDCDSHKCGHGRCCSYSADDRRNRKRRAGHGRGPGAGGPGAGGPGAGGPGLGFGGSAGGAEAIATSTTTSISTTGAAGGGAVDNFYCTKRYGSSFVPLRSTSEWDAKIITTLRAHFLSEMECGTIRKIVWNQDPATGKQYTPGQILYDPATDMPVVTNSLNFKVVWLKQESIAGHVHEFTIGKPLPRLFGHFDAEGPGGILNNEVDGDVLAAPEVVGSYTGFLVAEDANDKLYSINGTLK